jgi:Xaa-Pro aminopeptidase
VESPRPVFVVWPRHGAPALVLNAAAEPVARRDSWISNVVLYASYAEPPLEKVAAVLRDIGLADGQIGYEGSYMSAAQEAAFSRALPGARLVECTAMMDRVRWIKTLGEVALIKRGADILDKAFLEVFSTLRVGESERSAHARMVAACMLGGATFAHGWMTAPANTVHGGGQSDLEFKRGDVARTDYVSYIQGYPGHQSRNAVLGVPSPEQRSAYAKLRDVYLATADRCRPGVQVGAIHAFVADKFAKLGWSFRSAQVGHSIGTWWHQQEPIFSRDATVPLEAGMVIALEPTVGEWITQDLFLVTHEGPRLISDKFATDELYIVNSG